MSNQTSTKKPRQYHRITPAQMGEFKALQALLGNGSAAVRQLTPNHVNVGNRAYRFRKKAQIESTETYIDDQLQQIGVDAVNRLGGLVLSDNEQVATKNVQYAIDHIRGQATKKSVTLTGKFNIENLLP